MLQITMHFVNFVKQSNDVAEFSPNGQFLANGHLHRLIIRDVKSLQIVETFSCLDNVEVLQWSPDSKYILAGMYKRKIIQVWCLEDPEWTCQIDEGSLGFVEVNWSPDGRHILTTSKFNLRITVWSLMNKNMSYMKYAKQASPGMAFSPDGKYVALAESRNSKDRISIFYTSSWQLVKNFEPKTENLAGIVWSPTSDTICLWDSAVEPYNVCLYSLDGNCIATYSAYKWALGVKSVSWSPTSQFLAIGSYDQKVRLLNHITWKPIVDYLHTQTIISKETIIYKEYESNDFQLEESYMFDNQSCTASNSYEIEEKRPIDIPSLSIDIAKANPKHGIGKLQFSPDGRYIASINDNMPCVLWIWDLDKLEMSDILIQTKPIKCFAWCPSEPRIALCTANGYIYFWYSGKCTSVKIPSEGPFLVHSLQWHSSRKQLLLLSKDSMCLCILDSS